MNTRKLLLLFCLCSGLSINTSASFLNQVLDWTIVCGGSYIAPFIGTKSSLPQNFNLEQAIAQTPRYIQELTHEQCIKQHVDPAQFSVVAIPDCAACIWNFSLNSSGLSIQKLVALDQKYFEPPYNCGEAMLAHEIGHMQHKHPQKGIFGFLATPLLVQYFASKIYQPKNLGTTLITALTKICIIKAFESMLLGKLEEYQADGNIIKYCDNPKVLRDTAKFLRTYYYQNNFVIPAQLYKNRLDNYLEKSKFVPRPLKKILTKVLSASLILNWKLLTNEHPHPFSRAQRLERASVHL